MHDPSPLPSRDAPQGLVGFRILSGTGEELGVVVGIENDRFGRPKKLAFVEHSGGAAAAPRFVPLRFVRGIEQGVVKLAGPREGYHITRVATGTNHGPALARVMPTFDDDEDGAVWGRS